MLKLLIIFFLLIGNSKIPKLSKPILYFVYITEVYVLVSPKEVATLIKPL